MNKRIKSDLLLFITAIIWGSAFVAQKSGGEIGAFTFNGIRTFIGGLSLIPVIILMDGFKKNKTEHEEETKEQRKAMFIGGISCGILLFAASTLQQYGISYTTVGKAGFITSLYTILVSIISIIIGKKVRPIIWICVVTGAIGLYLLCVPSGEEFSFQIGDVLVFLCAIIFAIHILVVDHFSPKKSLVTRGFFVSQKYFSGVLFLILHTTCSCILSFLNNFWEFIRSPGGYLTALF